MGKVSHAACVLLALGLAACQSSNYYDRPSYAPPPTSGVEGSWIDQQGVAVSTLYSGVFESIATDTNQRISQGTYTYRNANTIDLIINSLIQGTTKNATCQLVTPYQLNCTNSDGVRFVLVRHDNPVGGSPGSGRPIAG
jgi:hypothetical protein